MLHKVTSKERSFLRSFSTAAITLLAVVFLQPLLISGCTSDANSVASVEPSQTQFSSEWKNVSIGGGGYVTGIELHPQEPNLVYTRTDVGGFYRWNPEDKRWIAVTDNFPLSDESYYGGEDLALDPANPDVVYIAAGKYTWGDPGTVFKSTDRGETWVKSDLEVAMGGNQEMRWTGDRLAVSPVDSNLLFFGSRQDGLWRSRDGGMSWTAVSNFPANPDPEIGIVAIAFDPNVPGQLYATAYDDRIYRSTDSGETWSAMEGSPGKAMKLAIDPDSTLYVTHANGVSKYTEGTWQDITPPQTNNGDSALFNGLSLHPTDPNRIIVSLGDISSTKTYYSRDGGSTWTEKNHTANHTVPWWPERYFKNHVSDIAFDPNFPDRVWFADWYGVWRTDDFNANPVVWTNYERGHEQLVTFDLVSPPEGALLLSAVADVEGFYHPRLDNYPQRKFQYENNESFQDTYSIDYSSQNPQHLVRVGGDRWNSTFNGATSKDGGMTWQKFPNFPDNLMPTRVAVSATDPERFVVSASEENLLQTSDGGASWQTVEGLPKGIYGPWNWSQPLVADSVNGNRFYYFADGTVYRSDDGGLSFSATNSDLPDEDWYAIKTNPNVEGEVWVGLDWEGLYRSTDGGETFSKIPDVKLAYLFAFGKPPAGSDIPALYLYGNVDGFGNGIFRSLDLGETWSDIGDPDNPIGNDPTVMEASKQQFGLVFLGTKGRGVYYKSIPAN